MNAKGLLQSKTVWGIVISVVAMALKKYDIVLDEAGLLNDIMALVASAFAVYGRAVASTHIEGVIKKSEEPK